MVRPERNDPFTSAASLVPRQGETAEPDVVRPALRHAQEVSEAGEARERVGGRLPLVDQSQRPRSRCLGHDNARTNELRDNETTGGREGPLTVDGETWVDNRLGCDWGEQEQVGPVASCHSLGGPVGPRPDPAIPWRGRHPRFPKSVVQGEHRSARERRADARRAEESAGANVHRLLRQRYKCVPHLGFSSVQFGNDP